MPVRFRCEHCDQLLGIARRKIGTEVRCPECHKMVLVPAEDAPDADDQTRKKESSFEAAVAQSQKAGAPAISPAAPKPFDAELYRLPDPTRAGGRLSPLQVFLLTLGAALILALAFTVGLLVGRFVL